MSKRQKSKRARMTCLACKTTYDPSRCHGGCPNCARERLYKLFAEIRRAGRE